MTGSRERSMIVSSSRPRITTDDHLVGMYRNSGSMMTSAIALSGRTRRNMVLLRFARPQVHSDISNALLTV